MTLQPDRDALLFEAVMEGAVIVGAGSRRVVRANPAAAAMLGYPSPEAMVNADLLDHIQPEDRKRAAGLMAGCFAGEDRRNEDLGAVSRDGRELHVTAAAVAVQHEGGDACLLLLSDVTARKAAERAIAEAQLAQRRILEKANEPIVVVQDGAIVYANPKTLELGRMTEEDMKGRPFADFLPPADREGTLRRYRQKSGEKDYATSFAIPGTCKDGSVRWAEIRVSSFLWEGRLAQVCYIHDVTEQKRAEEALRVSEGHYRLLAEHVSDVIWAVDLEFKPTYFNPAVHRLLGYTVEEALAGAVKMAPGSIEAAMKLFQEAMEREAKDPGSASGAPTLDLEFIHRDGSTVWASTTFSFLRDAAGRPAGVLGILHDVSERRRMEEALRAGEERFRALIENATDSIAVVNAEGELVYESPRSLRTPGEKTGRLFGERVQEALHPDDVGKAMEAMERAREHPGEAVEAELRYGHSDGSWRWAKGIVRSLLGDPRVNGIVINYSDITERKKAAEALADSERRYRLLAENVADVIFVLDNNLVPTYFSPSVARLTGWSVEEAMAGTMEQRLTVRSLEAVTRLLSEAWAEEEKEPGSVAPRGFEVELVCRDGSVRLADAMASFLRDAEGKVAGVVGTLHDISEKRRAEQALIESERRYRILAENLSDVIWVVNQDLRFTYVSPSVERLLGYTAEEAAAMPAEQIVAPESFETAMKVMAEEEERERSGECDRERSVTLELELPRKDGSTVWTENRVSYLRDPGGSVAGFLGVSRDIAERRRAREALRASEERFRTIFEESPIGAVVYDAAGKPLVANKACMDIFGMPDATNIMGVTLFTDPNMTEPARRHLRAGRMVTGEVKIDLDRARSAGFYQVARSGTVCLRFTMTPLGAGREGPGGYLAMMEDITERKGAEEALRASEERFRGLVETTSDWVWEVDPKGVYTYVSPKVTRTLGYDLGEVVGRTPFDFMPPRESRRVSAIFSSAVARQESFAFLENIKRRKDGHSVVMETSGVPFFGGDGTLLGFRGVDRDITERKEAARRLQQSYRKLERTMEAIIQAIATTMETRDPYTAGHQKRVTQLASLLARDMGLAPAQVAGIRVAGLLHDIGKISIPTEILSKPGQLTASEMAMIRFHPSVGYDILKNIEFEWPVAHIILQHHERLNGSGYPAGMRGEKILLEARILAVADVVEAMSSHRPYRPAVGRDKALEEIARGGGTLYDQKVVEACLEAFNKKGFQFE